METNRIILRPWRDSDAETLFKWASDPDVGPRAGWAPHQSVEDRLADICFVACCAWTLLPILELPQWLWLWAGVIVVIKVVNQISALVMYGRCCFPHTTANKIAGFLLFITVPMTLWSIIPLAIVAAIATFAAIHEGHYMRTNKIKQIWIK